MKENFDLNMHVARLLMNEPFFAALSRRVDKRAMTSLPTAAVRVNPDTAQFEMLYNPEFFAGLTDTERAGVLKHEFYHLVFEHVTGRLPDEIASSSKDGKVSGEAAALMKKWNYATDLAINSHLKGQLPEGCLMPGEGQEGSGEGESGEGDKNNNGAGQGTLDDHSMWGDVPEAAKEIAKERLKEAVKKAAEEATKAGSWGTIGADTRRDITDRLLTTKVDWRNVLRYFIKTSQKARRRSTIKRINKRYPYIHPGRKQTRQAKIAISIDQSGSVDDGMLAAFFAELNKLASLAEFTVVPFDTKVAEDKVFVWKKGENKRWERVMCGGTCFNAPTKYVNEKGFDGHIVLTDLMAPKPVKSKCQRMWMTTKEYAQRPYFKTNERIIAIEA